MMDTAFLIDWFSMLPPQLSTFLIAMIPITELRASIPIALLIYKLPVWQAMFFSIIGDFVPALFVLYLLGPLTVWCSEHSKVCLRVCNWVFARTRRKFSKKHAKYGALAVMIFVGIPLPFTGSWTGSLAAWLFDIPKKIAIPFIIGGIVIAAGIMTLVSIGLGGILRFFA